jgi:hypothetical protein
MYIYYIYSILIHGGTLRVDIIDHHHHLAQKHISNTYIYIVYILCTRNKPWGEKRAQHHVYIYIPVRTAMQRPDLLYLLYIRSIHLYILNIIADIECISVYIKRERSYAHRQKFTDRGPRKKEKRWAPGRQSVRLSSFSSLCASYMCIYYTCIYICIGYTRSYSSPVVLYINIYNMYIYISLFFSSLFICEHNIYIYIYIAVAHNMMYVYIHIYTHVFFFI